MPFRERIWSMRINLPTGWCVALGRQVRESTVGTLVLAVLVGAASLGACVAGIVFLPALGYLGWTVAAVIALWAWVAWGLCRQAWAGPTPAAGRRRWFRRVVGLGRLLLLGVLT